MSPVLQLLVKCEWFRSELHPRLSDGCLNISTQAVHAPRELLTGMSVLGSITGRQQEQDGRAGLRFAWRSGPPIAGALLHTRQAEVIAYLVVGGVHQTGNNGVSHPVEAPVCRVLDTRWSQGYVFGG